MMYVLYVHTRTRECLAPITAAIETQINRMNKLIAGSKLGLPDNLKLMTTKEKDVKGISL